MISTKSWYAKIPQFQKQVCPAHAPYMYIYIHTYVIRCIYFDLMFGVNFSRCHHRYIGRSVSLQKLRLLWSRAGHQVDDQGKGYHAYAHVESWVWAGRKVVASSLEIRQATWSIDWECVFSSKSRISTAACQKQTWESKGQVVNSSGSTGVVSFE